MTKTNPTWTWAAPVAAVAVLATAAWLPHPAIRILAGGVLMVAVFSAVHHAEVIAHRIGEPFGTLVLAVAVTVIEVALIVSLMMAAGAGKPELARDTVFAAVVVKDAGDQSLRYEWETDNGRFIPPLDRPQVLWKSPAVGGVYKIGVTVSNEKKSSYISLHFSLNSISRPSYFIF